MSCIKNSTFFKLVNCSVITLAAVLLLVLSTSPDSLAKNGDQSNHNRLKNASSPYLLQHADNPVDWYPWGEEAFKKAKEEDKPIFLSIGYSTCHWCHVMEHESFEDSEVAKLMNETFVSVKVDREERPDIDNVYMKVCHMMNQGGCGWPLTIFMTPDKEPFFAATYIPKNTRFGRTGMMELIPNVKTIWEDKRDEVLESANRITAALEKATSAGTGDQKLENEKGILNNAFNQLQNRYDPEYGGFGSSPKFPSPHDYIFLLRYWNRTGNEKALAMAENSLTKMSHGGIYDHIGFGFHRYSTDEKWLLPHFEKMLYDQAMISMAFIEAYLATGNRDYREVAVNTFRYVKRDMTDREGGFYSAEDADSEGKEGTFYIWEKKEIKQILEGKDENIFIEYYNIEKNGNFSGDPEEGHDKQNILHVTTTPEKTAEKLGVTVKELKESLKGSREKLFDAREERVHPHKDDKILTDWNGLMIASLANGAKAFNDDDLKNMAVNAADFIIQNMLGDSGKLYHRYRNGKAGIQANLDDYAFMVWGLIELYETTFNEEYLKAAIKINDYMIEHFLDDKKGGFFFTPHYGEELLVRDKEFTDRAVPSGNSVAVLNLLKLGRITADSQYEKTAGEVLDATSERLNRIPSAFTMMLSGLVFGMGPSYEVVIVGEKDSNDTRQMLDALRKLYVPEKVVLLKPLSGKSDITSIAEYTESQRAIDGKATAYVCQNFICDLPTNSVDKMVELPTDKDNTSASKKNTKDKEKRSNSLLGIGTF